MGKHCKLTGFIFFSSKITADGDWTHEMKRYLLLGRKAIRTNLDSILKSRDITLPTNVRLVETMVFSIIMCGCESKEGWALKNWCFWTVVLEKTLKSPLDSKIKPVITEGNQPWIFIGRTDARSSNTLATWCKEPTHWKIPGCWERLRGRREVVGKAWNG